MLCFFLLVWSAVCLQIYYFPSALCSELLSRHRRVWIIDSFTIEEEHKGPFPYFLGKIKLEQNYGVSFDLSGPGVDEEPEGVLSIDKKLGNVFVDKPVDYEKHKVLKVIMTTRKAGSIDTKLGIDIVILDINDNPPHFDINLYEVDVPEEKKQGSDLLSISAYDLDQSGTPNSTIDYKIKSVSPYISDTEFFINKSGTISFKGCLDHEAKGVYRLLVEAKDNGDVISLSSSTTVLIRVQDGNNHLPTISGQTGSGKIKEDEIGVSPLLLHVTDRDSPNSPAWRARFSIQGDEKENFKIETDPHTNDGVLTVVKPLRYKDGAQRVLFISVENESPYFSCKVKERTSSGLWKVDVTKAGDPNYPALLHSVKVVIEIEEINHPPVFTETVTETKVEENIPTGIWVEKVTAVDPDSSHAGEFVYEVGHDPAGWVTVDPHKGNITTVHSLDRESPHVVDGVYTVLLHAVDKGDPPMTGTATLNICVIDQNDNVPQLTDDRFSVCAFEGPTTTDITAYDLDGYPFGGPFAFELLGDVDGKWNLNPSNGYTAGLVKDPGVYPGNHTVDLKVSSLQGEFSVYSLKGTVCDCSVTPNCRSRRDASTNIALGALGIMFASLFLFLFLLLMAVVISCKKEFTPVQTEDSSGETLIVSNIEQPGTDCKVEDSVLLVSTDNMRQDIAYRQSLHGGMQNTPVFTKTTWNSLIASGYSRNQQIEAKGTTNTFLKRNSSFASDAVLLALLHRQAEEHVDYQPHLYADEGDLDTLSELEDITIPDQDSSHKALNNLGPKFNHLASISRESNRKK
ncbi:cadherin-like protein 26 isoform X2 [Labrus mixtus]|uniref:cadherin-like protein 26 isoform X2 n=1 Tax=Labrus mixtus TaxID=508554 RepID=UPI0029C0A493|nr:cadherin-like protein 26 isoform X2 [Labrus mixtus]